MRRTHNPRLRGDGQDRARAPRHASGKIENSVAGARTDPLVTGGRPPRGGSRCTQADLGSILEGRATLPQKTDAVRRFLGAVNTAFAPSAVSLGAQGRFESVRFALRLVRPFALSESSKGLAHPARLRGRYYGSADFSLRLFASSFQA